MITQNLMIREVAVKSIKKSSKKKTKYNSVLVANFGKDDTGRRHEIRRTLDGKMYICIYGQQWRVYVNSAYAKGFDNPKDAYHYVVVQSQDDPAVQYSVEEVDDTLLKYICIDQM